EEGSTSNLCSHAKACGGKAVAADVFGMPHAAKVREWLQKPALEKLTATWEWTGKGKITFSTTALTPVPAQLAWHDKWVTEKLRPFSIVND
ncbi:hypothetical protein BKA62DRAFT_598763, partial [Auriculariales sp. MPI-PUGE-AT-0066]